MKRQIAVTTALLVSMLATVALAQSIEQTPHNLSVTGPGTIRAATESQI